MRALYQLALEIVDENPNIDRGDLHFSGFYESMLTSDPDFVEQLLRSQGTYLTGAARDRFLEWKRDCIGVPYPTFNVLLFNSSPVDCHAEAIHYYVIDYILDPPGEMPASRVPPPHGPIHRIDRHHDLLPTLWSWDYSSACHSTVDDKDQKRRCLDSRQVERYDPVNYEVKRLFTERHVKVVPKPQSELISYVVPKGKPGYVKFQFYDDGHGLGVPGTWYLMGFTIETTCGNIRLPELAIYMESLQIPSNNLSAIFN